MVAGRTELDHWTTAAPRTFSVVRRRDFVAVTFGVLCCSVRCPQRNITSKMSAEDSARYSVRRKQPICERNLFRLQSAIENLKSKISSRV